MNLGKREISLVSNEFLNNLQENNEFPIIFIGSGITQRYFKNAPTWDNLISKIWNEVGINQTYFSRYNQLFEKYKDNFKIYTHLADELEQKYDQAFFDEKVEIIGLTPASAHYDGVSPFRKRISTIFSNLERKDDMTSEVELFFNMLKKARLILTTNYDPFIEKNLKNINIKIGNKGLFEPSDSLNELYKIHGSVEDANSIIITSKDYEKLQRTSAIVNAKILSQLTISPIIFFGYSLTDQNVQVLLKDLASNMPFSIEKAARRIGVVDYQKGKENIEETMADTSYGVHYTKLSTDNFKEIYKDISKINQGISPLEISKYQNAFRKIIDIKGRQGKLKQVLTSFVDLNKLPDELKSKNLVVALGDSRFIYKYPTYTDYVKDYFLEKEEMPLEIALRFIVKTAPNSTLPVSKYVIKVKKGKLTLKNKEIKRINDRLSSFQSLKSLHFPNTPKKYQNTLNNMDFDDIQKILSRNDDIKSYTKLNYFSSHIKNYSQETALKLITYILEHEIDGFVGDTVCRKLFMAYSLCYEPIVKKI